MLNKVSLQPAYILHSRLYRDTSALLEIFTPDYGRVSLVARGVRGQRGRFKGILQPFVPLLISWSGKTELMTLTHAETCDIPHQFTGDTLLCGIYLNELLMRLLHRYDAHPYLYQHYQKTLRQLPHNQAVALRLFEKQLLSELGYALQLDRDVNTQAAIEPEQFYYFDPAHGVFNCSNPEQQKNVFSGKTLLACQQNEFSELSDMRDIKRLLRLALGHLLGNKPLKSRELFL